MVAHVGQRALLGIQAAAQHNPLASRCVRVQLRVLHAQDSVAAHGAFAARRYVGRLPYAEELTGATAGRAAATPARETSVAAARLPPMMRNGRLRSTGHAVCARDHGRRGHPAGRIARTPRRGTRARPPPLDVLWGSRIGRCTPSATPRASRRAPCSELRRPPERLAAGGGMRLTVVVGSRPSLARRSISPSGGPRPRRTLARPLPSHASTYPGRIGLVQVCAGHGLRGVVVSGGEPLGFVGHIGQIGVRAVACRLVR